MSKPKHHQPSVKSLRVLISAASSITRAGLERLLEKQPSLHFVGAVGSADSLPAAIAENDPDVALLHLEAQSAETNWEELIALELPIVLLADEADLVSATAALAGGVQAILPGDAMASVFKTEKPGFPFWYPGWPTLYTRIASALTCAKRIFQQLPSCVVGRFADGPNNGRAQGPL